MERSFFPAGRRGDAPACAPLAPARVQMLRRACGSSSAWTRDAGSVRLVRERSPRRASPQPVAATLPSPPRRCDLPGSAPGSPGLRPLRAAALLLASRRILRQIQPHEAPGSMLRRLRPMPVPAPASLPRKPKITEQLCAPRLRTGLDMGHALKFVLVQTTSRSVGDRVRGRQLLRTIAGDHSHIGRDIGVVGGLGRRLQGALLRRFLLGSGRSLFLSGLVRAALARSLAPVFSQRFSWQHCEFRLLFSRLLCRGRQFCRTRVLRLGKSPAPVPPSPRAATSPVAIAFLGVLGLDPLRRFGGVFGSLALSTGFRLRSRGALVLPSQRALLLPRRTLFGRRRD